MASELVSLRQQSAVAAGAWLFPENSQIKVKCTTVVISICTLTFSESNTWSFEPRVAEMSNSFEPSFSFSVQYKRFPHS